MQLDTGPTPGPTPAIYPSPVSINWLGFITVFIIILIAIILGMTYNNPPKSYKKR